MRTYTHYLFCLVLLAMGACTANVQEPSNVSAPGLTAERNDATHATVIVRVGTAREDDARLSVGFADSRFDYETTDELGRTSFCFVGDYAGACAALEAGIAEINEAYLNGAHDDIVDFTCETYDATEIVVASYTLRSDYDDEDYVAHRRLLSCGEVGETTVLVGHAARNATWIEPEFGDSAFNYHSNRDLSHVDMCFLGDVSEVCGHVEDRAAELRREYYEEHGDDLLEDVTCTRTKTGDAVRTTYRIVDRLHGDLLADREIGSCAAR